ncbi:hypothetical protein [Geodermatophilus nigrescens]|uniref:Uncharacterized protein n=1 Tax=Geodermatophilus nigrescens TaxID=1070870 RepID=A0A1M5JMY5_9ACTN|nr:hypothetical protein [Geodermatophilus nigrescens]SHG41911.1 hypothetical protein SAMN05444351_2574 [Geodermatophilus nigrescens]
MVVLLFIGLLVSAVSGPGDAQEEADGVPVPTTTAIEPPQPSPEVAPEPPGFGDGTYLVGADITPGLYRSAGGGLCSWQRLSDVSGDIDAILASDYFLDGQAYVEVLPTDVAFSTDDCGRWTPADFAGPDVSTAFQDGTFMVGSDVQAGTYRSTGGSTCSWQRLSDLTGELDAIIASDYFVDGQAYVEVLPTDVAFRTDDCGTWSRIA